MSIALETLPLEIRLPALRSAEQSSIKPYEIAKRIFDLCVAGLAIAMFSPLLLAIALAIKLWDRGPVLFAQTRVGRDGRNFRCYKFRSMIVNAEALKAQLIALSHHRDPRTFKIPKDPRVTWIGRLLRKSSLDEMPQLWNVLKGDMSVVGPRPPLPSEVARYSAYDRRRLEVKPGLTCVWQVTGRGDLEFSQQVRLDVDYIERRSLWLDVRIVMLTVPAVFYGQGAY